MYALAVFDFYKTTVVQRLVSQRNSTKVDRCLSCCIKTDI